MSVPPVELEFVVDALRAGGSDLAAAMSGGYTKVEVRAMLDWGRGGHKAFAAFWREASRARGMKMVEVHKRVAERGDLASDLVANRWMGGEEEKGERGLVQNQVNVVIRKDFGEVVEGEMADE